ncbi:MAG: peptidylprolyl isomerase [Elainella sp. C42_A2020_010]|nr:peptidylprolyl isomerase [Elainella sp. C42_A2020_010]
MDNSCLKIGERLLCGDQIIAALVEYKLFDLLIGQVILDQFLDEVSLTEQEVYTALVGENDVPIPEDFAEFLVQWCEQNHVTWDYLDRVIIRDLRVEKFKYLYFDRRVETEFLQTKLELDQVEYSRIQVSDFFLAQELYFQIRDDGREFAQLAREYSLGNERYTEGWAGPVSLADLPFKVANFFKVGQIGAVYGPIPVDGLFWVVRLERITPARLTETTRQRLIERLYHRWLQSHVKELIAQPGAITLEDFHAVVSILE